MRKTTIGLFLLATLFGARAAHAYTCGAGEQTGRDMAGTGRYVWPTPQGTVLHGDAVLSSNGGRVFGYLGVPDEITDPNQQSAWYHPVTGKQDGTSLWLFNPDPNTQWWFELTATYSASTNTQTISGAEYAGNAHTRQAGTFTITMPFNNTLVTGMRIDCPMASPPTIPRTWTYRLQWDASTFYTGTMTTTQNGAFLTAVIGVPNELTDPALRANWNQLAWGEFFADVRGQRLEWLLLPNNSNLFGVAEWAENVYLPAVGTSPAAMTSFYNPSPNVLDYPWGAPLGRWFTANNGHN